MLLPSTTTAHLAAVFALAKPRLAAMSVLTTLVAYATSTAAKTPPLTLATLAGTTLAAAGALSLNQWWERDADALMRRTRGRPLPQASLSPRAALAWSCAFSCVGVATLGAFVNLASAAIAATIIALYGLVYTPLKRRTRWATEIGSLSGALPALLGNAAAGDLWSTPGLTLTALLLFWQMPHFFAIGWRHRADYRGAGFALLPAIDHDGARTAAWSLGYTIALVVVSLAPLASASHGVLYAIAVSVGGILMFERAVRFLRTSDGERDRAARRLFVASLIYLPLVLAALIAERGLHAL